MSLRKEQLTTSLQSRKKFTPGKFYGTLKTEVERVWNNRQVVLFDIDVKGPLNLKKQFGGDCITIFIAPPSKESLINRLKNRDWRFQKPENKNCPQRGRTNLCR